jgi:tRNA pseudouridine38-40 synthase
MRTHRFTLEYDGAGFEGWQRQSEGHRSVQATLEAGIARVTGAPVNVVGAGRTDAGVHAEGQVASARFATRLAPPALARALNAVLPRDLAVVDLAEAPDAFHARYHARSKHYRYQVWNGGAPSPLRAPRAAWVRSPLDLAAVRGAARDLVGTHDFASFRAVGSRVGTTVRSLARLDVLGDPGGLVAFELEATGFLRHMARTLVGTLLEVGRGRRGSGSMPALLAARDRAAAGPTAPACGLTLVRVDYD